MATPQPQPANYLGLWFILQDSLATGPVPTNQIILRKKAGDNTLYLETDQGEEEIVTSGGGGGGTFTHVTISGDFHDALVVENEAKTVQNLVVDTIDQRITMAGTLSVLGNIELTGTLSTIMSNVLSFDDSMLKLSSGQTTTDAYDQGWYAEYSPDAGATVLYRGCAFDKTDNWFKFFTGLATEPDGLSAIDASGSLAVDEFSCTEATVTTLNIDDLEIKNLTAETIDANTLDCATIANPDGQLLVQSNGTTSGLVFSADGKSIGLNKVPSAGQALDVDGGNIAINEGYLVVRRNVNGDNFISISNPNTGNAAYSILWLSAGTANTRFAMMSNTFLGGVGANNAFVKNDSGRLHLQSADTTSGLIINNNGQSFGFGEVFSDASGMVSMRQNGTTNNLLIFMRKDTYATELGIIGIAGNSWAGTVAGDFTLRSPATRKLFLGVQGTSPSVFNTSGSLGIRTSDPQQTLHVMSDSGDNGIRVQTNNATSSSFSRISFWGTSLRASIYTRNDTNDLTLNCTGKVSVPSSSLWVERNVNNDNFAAIINTDGGAAAKSSLYIRANTTADLRIYQNSPLNTTGIGANNADMYNGAGRLQLQSIGANTRGIIISTDGQTMGFNKIPSTAGATVDISGGAVAINATTNQLILGGATNTTITCPTPAASRVYTIPDAGAPADFVLTEGAQTINGAKTFSAYTTFATNSGAYTPVFSDAGGNINIGSPTNVAFSWVRIGNIVNIAGKVSFTTTAAANAVSFEFTTPPGITQTLTGNSAQGAVTVEAVGGTTGSFAGNLLQSSANTRLLVRVRAVPGASIGTTDPFGVNISGMFWANP